MKSLYKKRVYNYLPKYMATPEEAEWKLYCTRNSIRISPWATDKVGEWKICINLGPYKKGEKCNFAPHVYDKETLWPEYYRMCKYYYDKYRKSV
jgi:hypothetical protein